MNSHTMNFHTINFHTMEFHTINFHTINFNTINLYNIVQSSPCGTSKQREPNGDRLKVVDPSISSRTLSSISPSVFQPVHACSYGTPLCGVEGNAHSTQHKSEVPLGPGYWEHTCPLRRITRVRTPVCVDNIWLGSSCPYSPVPLCTRTPSHRFALAPAGVVWRVREVRRRRILQRGVHRRRRALITSHIVWG